MGRLSPGAINVASVEITPRFRCFAGVGCFQEKIIMLQEAARLLRAEVGKLFEEQPELK